jgi:D-sedoheptulose 7-phosphate isomerase
VARLAGGRREAGVGAGVRTSALSAVSAERLGRVSRLLERRLAAGERFFAAEADSLARLCHVMAERFARGGRLIAIGCSPPARSDARHIAVEFVHPVIVGKRALPALALTADAADVAASVELLATAEDIVIAFEAGSTGDRGIGDIVARARARGCLTVAFASAGAEWELVPAGVDPFVGQELTETAYHVLWELVHVFFEHRGLLAGREARQTHDAGASSFLYPFLAEQEDDLDAVLDDVRRSALMKAEEVGVLRTQTLTEGGPVLAEAADALLGRLRSGGKLLALGNGGSATDAMDVVADFRVPHGGDCGWPALDLTEDTGIITAVANDIGVEAIFSRQVIAYGMREDALLAMSTSGNSVNVIAALEQARRGGLLTIAMVGYDGGRVLAEELADHVIVTRSEHIPRIQEAQASAYHVLRELVAVAAVA